MKTHLWLGVVACVLMLVPGGGSRAQTNEPKSGEKTKSTSTTVAREPLADGEEPFKNVWGVDVLISNDGFGLGTYYRRALTPDLSGVVAFSISESKDSREVEQYDPYYQQTYTPGKLNRFLVFPLTVGVQYRLFREDIVDTFRPFVTAGFGPVMIYEMPFVTLDKSVYPVNANQVDFFKAIGRGHSNYTGTAFIGAGANFGANQSNVFGVNFRYYFTYLFSGSLPSMYNLYTGDVAGTKNSFGGFFIMLNIGMGY
ncbi:MAG: hypothetical protein WB699_01955 [Bacteroidota bacterium]